MGVRLFVDEDVTLVGRCSTVTYTVWQQLTLTLTIRHPTSMLKLSANECHISASYFPHKLLTNDPSYASLSCCTSCTSR